MGSNPTPGVVIYGSVPEEKRPFIYNVRGKEDIHDYGRRLTWALEKIKSEQRVPE
ncbi:MAG: hypothetical protein RAK20_06590 [Conexivisphaerales archaeon]|nr:hypothetical protein [Conexivisphaerales archaeon]